VVAIILVGAIIEEKAVIIKRKALWTKKCDELATDCIATQSFTLLEIYSSYGVNDIVFANLTGLILYRTSARWQTSQRHILVDES
jgi:hypothetical protein